MFQDFDFCSYTHFIFGKDAEKKVGKTLKDEGAKTVMLLHDPGQFLYESGLLHNVTANLLDAGLKVVEMGGVKPNPLVTYAEECIRVARQEGVDYLVSLGGGSVIDTGKAIAAGITYDGPLWDMCEGGPGKGDPSKRLRHAVILTNPATGSESGYGCMIDNAELQVKGALTGAGNWLRPDYCFMNPELSYSLPPRATGAGIVDMFSHAAERYFCNDPSFGLIDYMAEGLMRYLVENGRRVIDDPKDYEARGNIMYTGSVAHNDTVGVGRKKDMGTHDIAHVLSALYDTPHGVTISIIMPSWMRHVYKRDVERFARFGKEVFGVAESDDKQAMARAGIAAMEAWFEQMLCPTGFKGGNIPVEDVEKIAAKATKPDGKAVGRCYALYHDDILAIIRDAASR